MLVPDADVLVGVKSAVGARALKRAEAIFEVSGLVFERETAADDPSPTLLEIALR